MENKEAIPSIKTDLGGVKGCEECPPCQKQSYLNMWTIAIVVVSIMFVIYVRQLCVEHFKNKRDKAEFVQKNMYPMFYEGDATFGKYKQLVQGADAVEYYDLKKAFKQNKFTVDNIQNVV